MMYIKTFEKFINESEINNKDSNKISINERIYDTLKTIYEEASEHENDEDPAHTFESYVKESFLLIAEMATRVLKENSKLAGVTAAAAMKKNNEKVVDDKIIIDKTHDYLNDLMKEIKELYCDKMESMMEENPAIANIAAEALSKQKIDNPDANNY